MKAKSALKSTDTKADLRAKLDLAVEALLPLAKLSNRYTPNLSLTPADAHRAKAFFDRLGIKID